MIRGKCIYCKEEKDLNREHAFPKSLLQKGVRGWTIKKHVCVACNSRLAQLDAILIKKSPLAFVWDRIQDELGNKTQTPHSSVYHKKAGGINPLRQFVPDPHYENHIVLHETATMSSDTSVPVDSATALRPQIILTRYPEGQTPEEIIAENLTIPVQIRISLPIMMNMRVYIAFLEIPTFFRQRPPSTSFIEYQNLNLSL